MALSEKQECFVQEYLVDLNATQAYIRAGYSPTGANTSAAKLLAKPRIRARVDQEIAARSVRTGVTQDRVVRELARIAFASAPHFINPRDASLRPDATEDDKAAIASIRVKRKDGEDFTEIEREIKLADKIKALELLGKHMGMYTGNQQQTDNGVLPGLLEYLQNGRAD